MKFLAVLAVLAVAFAAVAVFTSANENDADPIAKNVASEEALAAELATAALNPEEVYVLTITTGFSITADKTIGSNVTVKVASGQTLTIDASKTLTNKGVIEILAGGLMTINGTIVNDGTITNNGGVDNWLNANVALNGTAKITTSGTAKGIIDGTNEPLVIIYGGTIENQIIDATDYTSVGGDLDQPIVSYYATATITNNDFKLNAGSSYGLAISAAADKKVTVTGNTFDANGGTIRKAINFTSGSASTTAEITGNDFTGVKYDFTGGKDADLVLGVDDNAYVFTVGPAGSGANLIIDSTIRSIATSAGADGVFTYKGMLTFENLNLRSGAFLDIAAGAEITVTKDVVIIGTLDNDGTIIVPSAYIATKVTDGEVKVAGVSGDVDSTTNPEGAITDESYEDGVDVIITTGTVTSAVIPEGKELVIKTAAALGADAVLDVSAQDTLVTVMGIDSEKSFTIKLGAGATEKLTVSGFQGDATFAKGSIIIHGEGAGITSGTFTITDGDVVKLSGNVTNATFNYDKTTGSAKIIVEAGDDNALNLAGTITMGTNSSRVTIQIDGKVTGGIISNASSPVVINDGAKVTGTVISGTAANISVYSGADINAIGELSAATWAKVTGKDATSGTWSYNATTHKLTLDGYMGTYNFGSIRALVTTIAANGTNVITYAPAVSSALFSNVSTIGSDEGTLSIYIDVSDFSADEIVAGSDVFYIDGDLAINQIGLTIGVVGSNVEWTEDVLAAADVVGIEVVGGNDLTIYNSVVRVNVLSDLGYDAPGVCGIISANISMISSALTVESKGLGIGAAVIEFMSSTDVVEIEAARAIDAGTTTILKTNVSIKGDVETELTISNESNVAIDGKLDTDYIAIDKQSSLIMKDLILEGDANLETVEFAIDKAAAVIITGKSWIQGTIDNSGTLVNSGDMYVDEERIINTDGTFTNSGSISVQKYIYDALTDANNDLTVVDGGDVSKSKVKIKKITLDVRTPNADGSAKVTATVTFDDLNDTGDDPTDFDKYEIPESSKEFEGSILPSQIDGKYTMVLRNGNAIINVAYNGTKTTVSATGSITVWEKADHTATKLFDIQALADAYSVTDEVKTLFIPGNAAMFINGGELHNAGAIAVYSGVYAEATPFIKKDATYNGPLTVGSENMYVAGTLTGDIMSAGEVEIKGTLDGNLTADSAIVSGTVKNGIITVEMGVNASTGKIINGKIIAKSNVNVKEMTGDIEISGKTADINVVFKKFTGELIFNSTYNVDEPEPPATPTTETVTSTMDIAADSQGTTFILKGATNKAGSTAGAPGYFILKKDSLDATLDKVVDIKLTAGKLVVAESTVLMKGYVLTIEADTTIEISDKNATLDVTGAALKVSDSAVQHFEEGAATPVSYGKVVYIMKFPISGGYTIYSNIAYALSNSDAGSTLTMGQSDTVDSNVIIGEGIKVIVPKDIVLTFDGHNVMMADTASIVLEDNGKVIFQASTDDSADPELEPGDAITYYSVTGTIVFDDDNAVKFYDVRFSADSTIVGVKATETELSKISATLLYKEGTASIASGVGVGTITLENYSYPAYKGDEPADYELGTSVFNVAEGAFFEATAIYDMCGIVDYDEFGLGEEPKVKKIKSVATTVDNDGTLYLKANNTDANGVWISNGTVFLKDKSTFTVFAGDAAISEGVDKMLAGNVSIAALVDTTDNLNGYKLALVSPILGGDALIFNAKEYKIEGTNTKVVSINGDLGVGIISATTCAVLDALFINEDAAVVADVTYVMGANESTAFGYLMTMEIYQGTTGYQELDYQVTFEKEGYTTYTYFATVDFDEISDIAIADNADLSDLAPAAVKVDLSGKDVNITIAEGKTLVLDIPMIIGTPITVLGDSGSSISGKVIIGINSYLVAYSDVDLFDAEILGVMEEDAAYSVLTIEDVLYATIFANEDDDNFTLADVDKKIVPAIVGYSFTKWINLNEDPNALVGETNAYAGAKAILVTVTVKFAEGVSYYLDGVEFAIYDVPTNVEYNSVFTAKINNTAKYQGTPLINGQNSFIVTEDATLTVSGVTPIPEPEPEPVIGDSGISLTDILLIVLVVLIAIMVVILVLRLNRS